MKKIFGVLLAVVVIALAVCGCFSSSGSSSRYSGYSNTYQTDAEYRKNVKDIAGVYGKSEKEVDRMINAITGGR